MDYDRLMFGSLKPKPIDYIPILDKLYPSNGKAVNIDDIDDFDKALLSHGIIKPEVFEKYQTIKEKEIDNMDIINLYFDRKEAEIHKKFNDKIAEIKKNDEIQLIVDEMTSQINAILENENRSYTQHFDMDIHTQKTQTALEKVNEDKKNELYKLKKEKEEVIALFQLTQDYSERMKILKDYGIISKSGKVNN